MVARRRNDSEVPIANPSELTNSKRLWLFQFGAAGDTYLYVWNDSEESAFEEAVEWLDENAPGHLTNLTEKDLRAAAADENIRWEPTWPDWDDPAFAHVVQAAEADLTQIGHTTLKHGQYLVSHEWAFDEVHDKAELLEVALASYEEDKSILDFEYEAFGPEKKDPEGGIRVEVNNGDVDATEWTDIAAATGADQPEGEEVSKQEVRTDLEHLLSSGRHRGTYSGDAGVSLGDVLIMTDGRKREQAIVAAAIGRLANGPNDESYVSYVGED